jgi:hypothetical protein
MVGGGSTFDDLQIEGSPNLKECGQLDMPGFTVTKAKAEATDTYIAAVPNPAETGRRVVPTWPRPTRRNPATSRSPTATWTRSGSSRIRPWRCSTSSASRLTSRTKWPTRSGPGLQAHLPERQGFRRHDDQLHRRAGQLGLFLSSLKEDGVDIPMFAEANQYDPVLLEKGSNPAGRRADPNSPPPFEEADDYPAIQKFEELMDARKEEDPKAKTAALGIQSMSSWLLFTEAATACAESDDHIISHDCVRKEVEKIGEWTGGGLHSPGNPGKNTPSECVIVMTIDGDKFARKFPEVGSKDANEDGYYCPEKNATVEIDVD